MSRSTSVAILGGGPEGDFQLALFAESGGGRAVPTQTGRRQMGWIREAAFTWECR